MSAREPIPLHIVTGFLGAGKTSLINRLLSSAALADSLVIVNEWGEIGLDHLLFEAIEGEVISLNSGCLCCTLRGDLVDRLNDLIDRRDAATIAPFARVILETTGLADPAPILLALAADPRLAARFRVAGVTTLIDAVNGEATLAAHGEAQRQAALADRIGLAKSDLVAADERSARLAAVRAALGALNPVAPIVDVAAGELDADGVPGRAAGLAPARRRAADRPRRFGAQPRLRQRGARSSRRRSGRFLDLLSELLGPRLLRVKGLIGLADNPDRPLLIHGAQHVFHAAARPARLAGRRAAEPPRRHRRRRRARPDRGFVGGADRRAADRRPRSRRADRQSVGPQARRTAGVKSEGGRRVRACQFGLVQP